MADFEVRADQLKNAASQFNNIQRSISKVSSEVSSVLKQTRGSITARIGAALQRTVVCANINNCATDMKNLSQGLSEAVQYYIAYEKNVYNKTFGKTVKVKSKSIKNKWEQFKDTISDKVKGISKAVKEKVENIKSAVKNTAKKLWEGIKDTASKTWDFVKDTAGNIKDGFVNAYNYLKDSYNEHGWVYKAVQYGKAAITIIGSTAAIVTAVASIAGSGGLSTPAAIATIIYSLNSINNSFTDISNVYNDNYDKVGNVNWMKERMADVGGWVGEKLGNEDIGRAIGTGVYHVGSLYTVVANLNNTFQGVKQVDSVKTGDVLNGVKKLGKENFYISDIPQWKYQVAMLKTVDDYKPLFDFAGNAKVYSKAFLDTVDFAFGVGEAGIDVYNVATDGNVSSGAVDVYNNVKDGGPVIKTYKDIKGAYKDVKDTGKSISDSYKAYKIYRAMKKVRP